MDWLEIHKHRYGDVVDDLPSRDIIIQELIVYYWLETDFVTLIRLLQERGNICNVFFVFKKIYISFTQRAIYCGFGNTNNDILNGLPFPVKTLSILNCSNLNPVLFESLQVLELSNLSTLDSIVWGESLRVLRLRQCNIETLMSHCLKNAHGLTTLILDNCTGLYDRNMLYKIMKLQPNLTRFQILPMPASCNMIRDGTVIRASYSSIYKHLAVKRHLQQLAVTFYLSARARLGRDIARLIARHIFYDFCYQNDDELLHGDFRGVNLKELAGDRIFIRDDDEEFRSFRRKQRVIDNQDYSIYFQRDLINRTRRQIVESKQKTERLRDVLKKRERKLDEIHERKERAQNKLNNATKTWKRPKHTNDIRSFYCK